MPCLDQTSCLRIQAVIGVRGSASTKLKCVYKKTLYNERKLGVNEIAADLEISKMTLYKYLRHRGVIINCKS